MSNGMLNGRREQTKAANQAAILAGARGVFSRVGYGAATVRDIVRATDLATGTFYNYFPDKESVLHTLLDEAASEIRARVRAARTASSTIEQFVESGYRAYYEYLVEDPETFELMRRNAGTIRSMFDEPALGAGVKELHEDLDGAARAGLVPAHDSEYMASAMVGAGFEVAVRMLEREPPDVDGAVAFVSAVFLAGLSRGGDAPQPAGAAAARRPA